MSWLNDIKRGYAITRAASAPKPSPSIGQTIDQQYGYKTYLKYGSTGRPWNDEVGDVHANAVVASILGTIAQKLAQGRVIAATKDRTNVYKKADKESIDVQNTLEGYPFGRASWVILGISLVSYGMAYLRKVRDRENGLVIGYVPYMKSQVVNDPINGRMRYRLYKHGGSGNYDYAFDEDIIVLRYGVPDPRNPLEWYSPLLACLREIFAENECSTFIASTLNNMVMPTIVSPKTPVAEKQSLPWVRRVKEAISSYLRDLRGAIYASPEPIEVTQIGFDANAMQVVEFDLLTIAKICSAASIDPMVVNLPSENKTYANYGEARKAMIEDCILPLWSALLEQIKPHLIYDGFWRGAIGSTELIVEDGSYPELEDDRFKVSDDLRNDWKAGLLNLGEYRRAKGFKTGLDDKRTYFDLLAASRPAMNGTASRRLSLEARRQLELLHERIES